MTKQINLPGGRHALVDDADYDRLSEHKWHVNSSGYAARCVRRAGGGRFRFLLHREVFGAVPVGLQIDHIDGNKLDNRRANLRLATPAENRRNCRRYRNNSSGYKGVSWHRASGRWLARIGTDGQFCLGYFADPAEAARAYDAAALELFSGFAKLNFPDKTPGISPPSQEFFVPSPDAKLRCHFDAKQSDANP